MAYGLLTVVTVVACLVLASMALRWQRPALRSAGLGLAAGYGVGVVAAFVLALARVSLPQLQVGNVAFTASGWLPPLCGVGGLVVGAIVGSKAR